MVETYPISCISCRRKKIKCNKLKPCNQCKKRQIVCQFPSTFRNIEIKENDPEAMEELIDATDENYMNIINKLNEEKDAILKKNMQLNERNKQLNQRLYELNAQSNYFDKPVEKSPEPDGTPGAFKISGETSELGKKYYGPQSSSFMIETLKSNSNVDSNNFPQNYLDKDNNIKVEKSLLKKPLPTLKKDLNLQDNLNLIERLVEKFFQGYSSNYYKTFISKINILDFLHKYSALDNHSWEHDDDLLLLIMILVFALERSTPAEIIEIFDIQDQECAGFTFNLIHNNLIFNFEKLRHNLINESILTIQGYILCTEYYFIEQRYEECWSMMFHTCSIAYSIGLHVTKKLKLNKFNEIDLNTNLNEDHEFDDGYDELEDIMKLKVWFLLRILSDKVCSILGRPNPISIQMNSIILKYNQNYTNINLNQNSTSILLRIGLSECLRLSNMMLIENFMIDFSMKDLLNLNAEFEKEIDLLELYLDQSEINDKEKAAVAKKSSGSSSDVESQIELSYDELNYLPIKIDKLDLLNDLIIFHINKAKLFEPFIIKFSEHENDSLLILKNLANSIIKFLDLTYRFFELFEIKLSKKKLNYLNIGKYFRINFPFLNSFIYQGIIIIFTLLNYKSKDFSNPKFTSFPTAKFLWDLRYHLVRLSNLDKNFDEKMWSVNIIYLIVKNLEIITLIEKLQDTKNMEQEFLNNTIMGNNLNNSTFMQSSTNINNSIQDGNSDLVNFNLNDPFWITNPDNLPYYLSSPPEEFRNLHQNTFENGGGIHGMSNITNPISNSSTEIEEDKRKKIKLEDFIPGYNYRK